ncbi:MAG: hypothetical protein II391_00005, partial [Kiritimatiellae bacterium]|nr:hypothetical protein [Kiritimatiellia bacterium]
ALSVSYKGWTCRYSTDGEIVDMDAPVSNRNGRYRVFEARGRDSLKVRISIFPEKTTSKTRGRTDESLSTRSRFPASNGREARFACPTAPCAGSSGEAPAERFRGSCAAARAFGRIWA